MKNLNFIVAGTLLLFLSCQAKAHPESKPNVIIIMSDDQGNNLGCLGNPDLDGVSFKPGLYGQEIPGNNERPLVISKFNNDESDTLTGNLCVMYGDWRFTSNSELFNVKDDPAQKEDLADRLRWSEDPILFCGCEIH